MRAAQAPKFIFLEPKVIHRPPIAVAPADAVTQAGAAAFIGVDRHTLARWARRGEGPPFYRVGQLCLYRLADLDAFIADGGGKGRAA
jgi:hypothetical protein